MKNPLQYSISKGVLLYYDKITCAIRHFLQETPTQKIKTQQIKPMKPMKPMNPMKSMKPMKPMKHMKSRCKQADETHVLL